MDRLHRKPRPKETRTGHDCQFCRQFDPEFGRRDPMDREHVLHRDRQRNEMDVSGEP